MSSAEDIREVMLDETQRGRRFEPALHVARPAARVPEVATMPIKVQKFGELLVRVGNAIEGYPEEESRAALELILARFPPKPSPIPNEGYKIILNPMPTPSRPTLAARPTKTERPIHASPAGAAAKELLDALRTLGGQATTRQIAEATGKSISTVSHTLRAVEASKPRLVTRIDRGVWRLGPGS